MSGKFKDQIKEKTVFEANGKNFESLEEAERECAAVALYEFVEKTAPKEPDYHELTTWLRDNHEKLIHMLNQFY